MARHGWVWIVLPLSVLMLFISSLRVHPVTAPYAVAESPAMKSYTETIPGSSVKFDMLPIPGGEFAMGSPAGEAGRSDDESPLHTVRIRPLWMGKTEVTWDEYDVFAFSQELEKKQAPGATVGKLLKGVDAVTRPTPPYADESFGYGKGKRPSISMTHHAAMEYCRWLSTKTGKTYRLPTEAEWEYACRAGSKTAYSFGASPSQLGDYAWFNGNSDNMPHIVGLKKPNAWGLHDMHGNVAEWCVDDYDKDFYRRSKQEAPAIGPVWLPTEQRYAHVVRGGSWDDETPRLRSAARRASNPDWSLRDPQSPQSIWWHTEATFVGFRVVRPLEEQENLKGLKSKVTRESP
ncbi:MAG: formylglycine-generating enzyme family protein [Acidobacteria bacterium]|nr:formylglycine-generating enzyme family protein [Acidobacteriota bacterium]MBI3656639.1 formylglycine-generating enzyme family protein [Acidobacteriota bacterium]